jgi:hypothetical protein
MTQTTLNRAVARATGETVERIQRMGFTLMTTPPFFPKPRVLPHSQFPIRSWGGLLRSPAQMPAPASA